MNSHRPSSRPYSHMIRRLFPLMFLLLVGCAHMSASQGPDCIRFESPKRVMCHAGGHPMVDAQVVSMCHKNGPNRWTITDSGGSITIVGADCVTILNGDQ